MFNTNPVEYYYSNDYYLSQIIQPQPIGHRSNTSYSPKKLITGYWKKDYQSFIKQKTLNLESKEICPHIVIHKNTKPSFAKLAETILNVSNCFENIPNRQTKTDKFVQKIRHKITSNSPSPPKLNQHDIHKIPGRLYKGTLPKNFDNSINLIDKSYILDSKQEFASSFKSASPKADNKEEFYNVVKKKKSKSKEKQISTIKKEPTPSPYREIKQQLMIRKSMLNNNTSHSHLKKVAFTQYFEQQIEGMKLETLQIKLTANNIYNLVMIQFENVLGFDESSYFGPQSDFIGSKIHQEYVVIRDHYFQRVNNHSTFYVHKNIKELFNSISRVYQIGLYTLAYPELLKEFVTERKLRVNGVFKVIDYKLDMFVIDVTEVLNQLKIKNPQLLIFIQPYSLLNQQQSFIPKHTKIPYYEYSGQRFLIPFTQSTNPQSYRLLALPQLTMQSLFISNEEQSKGFVQTNYFIEQFTLALQSDCNFQQYLQKSQNKIKCINQSSYFRAIKQRLLQQLYYIDTLRQPNIKIELKCKKQEMVERIIHKFECSKQVEALTKDLVQRNKDIMKKIKNYKQEKINTLNLLHQQLQEQLIRLNYCEMFVDSCYYLPY